MTKTLSYVFGVVVLALGVIGFFSDPIFGVFEVDAIHNSIYIALGLILLASAMKDSSMGAKIVGVLALIVSILGFIPPSTSVLNLVETNTASSILQIVVAVVLLYSGFVGSDAPKPIKKEGVGDMGDMQKEPEHPSEPEEPQMQEDNNFENQNQRPQM